MKKVQSYQDLEVWKKAMVLASDVYEVVEGFPAKERYRLVDQLCRASVSVPSNIAEGSSRGSTKEFIRFLNIAYGSLAEIETQLLLANKFGYMEIEKLKILNNNIAELGRMTNGLIRSLQQKLQTINENNTELRTLNSGL